MERRERRGEGLSAPAAAEVRAADEQEAAGVDPKGRLAQRGQAQTLVTGLHISQEHFPFRCLVSRYKNKFKKRTTVF